MFACGPQGCLLYAYLQAAGSAATGSPAKAPIFTADSDVVFTEQNENPLLRRVAGATHVEAAATLYLLV